MPAMAATTDYNPINPLRFDSNVSREHDHAVPSESLRLFLSP